MARTTTTPTRTAAVVGRWRWRRRPEWLTRRGLPSHRDRVLLIRVHRRTRTRSPEQVLFVVVVVELVDFFSVVFVFFVRLFEPFRRR